MSDESLRTEFDAARAKRGKARTEALAAFAARGDAALPVLLEALGDDNKPRRELALDLLRKMRPATDAGRAALREGIAAQWRATRVAQRLAAFELLGALGDAPPAALAGPLTALLAAEYDAEVLGRALPAIAAMGLAPDALTAALDPVLDHWSTPTRAAAAALLTARGVTPRASAWANCPLPDEVVQHVRRLGGVPRAFDPNAPRPVPECSWARMNAASWQGQDPEGQLTAMPAVAQFFDRDIEWTRGRAFRTWDRDFPQRTLELTATSENFDWQVNGGRVLLYAIGYCSLQYYYCLDLLDASPDPRVYTIDHGGGDSAYLKFPTLSRFLAWLQTP